MATFTTSIPHTADGEAVSAVIDSRAARVLEENIKWLKEQLEAASLGSALFRYQQSLEGGLVVGTPVYYNSVTQRFEAALAAAEVASDTGVMVAAPSADVIGLIFAKTNDTLGDIFIAGTAELDLSDVIEGGNAVPGRYGLAADTPGKLVNQTARPSVWIPVCYYDSNGFVYLAPYVRDFVESHVHYAFDLYPRPAGVTEPPEPGERHTIIDPDADAKGWLPVDHPSFEGHAPNNAVFGYNLAAHPEVQAVWPPIPVEAITITLDKGDGNGAGEVPLGQDGLISVDEYGIWWLSDCYDDVPWAVDYTGGGMASASSIASENPECPRSQRRRIRLYYLRMAHLTDKNVVTDIAASSDSPIQFVNAAGSPASRGSLVAQYNQAMVDRYYQAAISGTATEISNFRYWTMPAGVTTTIYARIKLPGSGLPIAPKMKLRMQLLGRAGGTLPTLTVTYRRRTQAVDSALTVPTSELPVTITTAVAITLDKYRSVESEKFEVAAGDEVLIKIVRSAGDGFAGELGLMDLEGILSSS